MPSSTAEQMREWRGPALLSYGFRPFFLLGAGWAALAMVLWICSLTGVLTIPSAFDAASWHAHAFMFGFLPAIVAGFLLTAVPNWTGRLPVVGYPLGALVTLWVMGRLAVLFSAYLPPLLVALVDLSALTALGLLMAREIFAGKNWRNLIVLAMLAILIFGNAIFHIEAARGDYAAQGYGLRIGLASAVLMIGVIGGRIVPSFTRNWLVKAGHSFRPAPPMQRLDKLVLLASVLILLTWVLRPEDHSTGALLMVLGLLHLFRLSRWGGQHSLSEPLLLILHVGYAFIPLGAIFLGLAIIQPDLVSLAAAQHLWMGGAIAVMTFAVMTRATLGHTGHALIASRATVGLFILLVVSSLARLVAGVLLDAAQPMYHLAGLTWILGFGGFVAIYGPMLLTRQTSR